MFGWRVGCKRWLFWKVTFAFLGVGLTVRVLPYLAPIRADDLVQDEQAIEFRDRNNLPLGTLLTRNQEHTAVVPLEQVSPRFIAAILAAEDGRFYHHGPLELRAIARSLLHAIRARRIVSGASTITMQLARMLEPAPRTLPAKLREVWLSWRLAAGTSKDDILAAYINRLPMGGNIYGIEAAARIYFGLPAADLNLAQASLLAGLPNNPNHLNPYDHWHALKRRQIYVLNRMVEDGHITQAEANRAYAEEISLQPRQQGIIAAPHFLFWVADRLPADAPAQIRTSLDRSLQQFVAGQVQQVTRALASHNVRHAAALVIDNQTGEVLAYVGSPDYFAAAQGRNDGVQALRQPGSTLKPFLYQLALEAGAIRPQTILADVPTHYAIPGAKLYSPVDYDETFQGPVRVRVALANSLNIPAVRVLEKVGISPFLHRLHQLGFEHLDRQAGHYGLGLALGSGEVSLWELAHAYVTLANQGELKPFVTIMDDVKIQNPKSKIQNPFPDRPWSWALIADMLSDRHARAKEFGVDSVLNLPFSAAVKTGTSSNFRDTWAVGFTTDYTVATWVGNFDGEPMRQVSGVLGAAPLWHRILLHLHEQQLPAPLASPAGMVQRPICAVTGLRPTPDCTAVVQEYFALTELGAYERQGQVQTDSARTGAVVVEKSGKKDGNQTGQSLPDEYDGWLALQPRSRPSGDRLRLLSPRDRDIFLLFPSESESASNSAQQLEFKLAGSPAQPVEWWLNGQKLATQADASFFWLLRPGDWTLEVRSGEMRDRVRFQVQQAETQPRRQGFSLRNSRE